MRILLDIRISEGREILFKLILILVFLVFVNWTAFFLSLSLGFRKEFVVVTVIVGDLVGFLKVVGYIIIPELLLVLVIVTVVIVVVILIFVRLFSEPREAFEVIVMAIGKPVLDFLFDLL